MLSQDQSAYLDAFATYRKAAHNLSVLLAQVKRFTEALVQIADECRSEGATLSGVPAGLAELPTASTVNQVTDDCRSAWRGLRHLWNALPAEARTGLKAPAEAAT